MENSSSPSQTGTENDFSLMSIESRDYKAAHEKFHADYLELQNDILYLYSLQGLQVIDVAADIDHHIDLLLIDIVHIESTFSFGTEKVLRSNIHDFRQLFETLLSSHVLYLHYRALEIAVCTFEDYNFEQLPPYSIETERRKVLLEIDCLRIRFHSLPLDRKYLNSFRERVHRRRDEFR
ncbi:MAG: hypothetical protein P1V18_03425 [Candidatus Gracilibacteria bacterium]|nr:hypothetical protein [Candidatus Gracilibacteria bacterium]